MVSDKKRNGEIDVLRFVFCIFVLLYHYNINFNCGIFSQGCFGVEFFFVVSGYLMVNSCRKDYTKAQPINIADYTWRFVIKKIKSYFRYFAIAVILEIFVRRLLIQRVGFKGIVGLLLSSTSSLMLTDMVLTGKSFPGNSWFLSAQIIAILILYPLLLKTFNSCSKIIFPLIGLFGLGYLYKTYGTITIWNDFNGICYAGIIRAISEISIGASINELIYYINTNRLSGSLSYNKKILLTIIKAICYILVFIYAYGKISSKYSIYIFIILSIGITGSFSNVCFSIRESKITRYLAKISLTIYIFHGFIRWCVKDIVGDCSVSLLEFFAYAIGSAIISIALMYFTDYITKRIKRIWNKI